MNNQTANNIAKKAKEFAEKARSDKMEKMESVSQACLDVIVKLLNTNQCTWNANYNTVTIELENKATMINGRESLEHLTQKLNQIGFNVVSHEFDTEDYIILGLRCITLAVNESN